jgi:hypothetical protein
MLASTTAQNVSLDAMYGATKAAGAPASFHLALYAGDPTIDGTELTGAGGYARLSVTNNGTNFPAASDGRKATQTLTLATSTGAWSAVATHWALLDASTGDMYDTGALLEEIDVTASGQTATVRPVIFYTNLTEVV